MNEENKQSRIELISKYLAGEATPEEAMQLHDFLKVKENKDEYNKIAQLWNRLPNAATEQMPRVEHEWLDLRRKIKPSKKSPVIKLIFSRVAVAAGIIGLILAVSYVWLRMDKKQEFAQVKQHERITKSATNQITTDTLPDGSMITVNKNSSVAYSSTFATKNRELQLQGEAYFNVVPDKTKPFIITIDELKIKVVGTSFNVRNIAPAGSLEVQVQSGVVKMYTAQKEITVVKGQTGTYHKHDGVLNVKNELDLNSISYATKTFYFNDLPFVDACRYLEKAFNIIIKLDEQKFAECRLSAEFNNKSLDYILEIISATLNSSYKKQGNTIYITGEGCQ